MATATLQPSLERAWNTPSWSHTNSSHIKAAQLRGDSAAALCPAGVGTVRARPPRFRRSRACPSASPARSGRGRRGRGAPEPARRPGWPNAGARRRPRRRPGPGANARRPPPRPSPRPAPPPASRAARPGRRGAVVYVQSAQSEWRPHALRCSAGRARPPGTLRRRRPRRRVSRAGPACPSGGRRPPRRPRSLSPRR
ncbi:unnamed protein product [Rangifer tarandus platyrhynchus]|uniref:Uncharacterized protein n=1 Tax=Rangifer tarandus platyrhynchus TaxID=3082113 RepID=A0AC60A2S2_RANTA